MDTRTLGRTGRTVSVIGLGTWQLGADWGDVDDDAARAVLDASFEAGVTMYDTADVYGDGRSEQRIGSWLDARGLRGQVFAAPQKGRRGPVAGADNTLA
ncbi:aldo/keto reductase, partial [Paeniglutamicibacter sp.]|uniref:aldo/keto reductase n=1 Tax=Paeniglutamicibacter sp. TaxID=1934391 RepID=UPI00398A10A1